MALPSDEEVVTVIRRCMPDGVRLTVHRTLLSRSVNVQALWQAGGGIMHVAHVSIEYSVLASAKNVEGLLLGIGKLLAGKLMAARTTWAWWVLGYETE